MFKTLLLGLSLAAPAAASAGDAAQLHVLASTYPIYLLTQGVTAGVDGLRTDLLLPAALGCPHDYSPTPEDLRKLEGADVLVVNGLGMEEFLGSPAIGRGASLRVIDASRGLSKVLQYTDDEEDEAHHDHEEGEHEHHHHHGPNPHYFASPRAAALVVRYLGEELSRLRPAAAPRLRKNALAVAARLDAAADALRRTVQKAPQRRVVTQHGAFDYLAADTGLEIAGVIAAHPGQEPSASELRALLELVKTRKVRAIFAEPQYPGKVAEVLARESHVAVAVLDPVASGPEGAGIDHYLAVMDGNRRTLENVLGVR
jgi:ABC-type Zn uptake system ZnuABC Zn-binding protein ZnuA